MSAWSKCKGLAGKWWHSTDTTAVGSMKLAEPWVEFFEVRGKFLVEDPDLQTSSTKQSEWATLLKYFEIV